LHSKIPAKYGIIEGMPVPEFVARPGQIDYTHAKRAPVLNCIVKHGEKILIVQRNPNMHFHPGVWNGISGFLDEPEKSVADKVREELFEEAGIDEENIISLKEGAVVELEDSEYGKTWVVHSILAEVKTNAVRLDWEAEKYLWITPEEVWDYPLIPGFDAVVKTFFP
jgi:8-oxo-dGTP pyrophosphatase MutT (NUDIX family)